MRRVFLMCVLVWSPAIVLAWVQLFSTSLNQLTGEAENVDFVSYYGGAYRWLHDGAGLYSLAADRAFQLALEGQNSPPIPFLSPPHAAMLLAPLTALPYACAYLFWLAVNLACLTLAVRLLAPRVGGSKSRLKWLALTLTFGPTLLNLVMGQLSCVLLLAAAVLIVAEEKGWLRPVLALVAWTFKPQLLPVYLLFLVLRRQWRPLAGLTAIVALLTLIAVSIPGPDVLSRYVQVAGWKWSVGDDGQAPGNTLRTLALDIGGAGAVSTVLYVAAVLVLLTVVGWLFSREPGDRAQRWALRAMPPLTAVLCAPHALAYEQTLWLAAFWCLLRASSDRPGARRLCWLWGCLLWSGGWISVLWGYQGGFSLGALAGLLGVCLSVYLGQTRSALKPAAADRNAELYPGRGVLSGAAELAAP